MRKFLMLVAVLLLAIPFVAAQTDESDETGEEEMVDLTPWTCPEGYEGQTLSIYNWSTYIAEDTIPNFEEACGVTVNYDTYDSSETMLARIRQGNPGYDLIVPSGSDIYVMAREDLLIPLDKELLPNMVHILPEFVDPPYDPGNQFTVPYQWGTVGIGYNTEVFPDGISSWDELWEHDGNVAWLDDREAMFGIALLMQDMDANDRSPEALEMARDYLLERGDNVVAIAADDGQVLLERGEVDATIEYSGDIFALAEECECDDYWYAIPEEGTNVWTDVMAVPVDAPNPELAMVFMNYILDPQVGADLSNWTAYASPNSTAIDEGLIEAELLNDPAIYPSAETLADMFILQELSPEAEELVNNAWDELLIFLGQ